MADENEKDSTVSRFDGEDHHGWSPDVETGNRTANTEKAFESPVSKPSTGAHVDHSPGGTLSSTDMEPESPIGAAESDRRSGEEIGPGPGEDAEGHKGVSQRPYGTSGT